MVGFAAAIGSSLTTAFICVKLLRQKLDILEIKKQIKNMKDNENEYYKSLLLTREDKKRIFNLDIDPNQDVMKNRPKKIIAQDPYEGNLVMTEEEFRNRYGHNIFN